MNRASSSKQHLTITKFLQRIVPRKPSTPEAIVIAILSKTTKVLAYAGTRQVYRVTATVIEVAPGSCGYRQVIFGTPEDVAAAGEVILVVRKMKLGSDKEWRVFVTLAKVRDLVCVVTKKPPIGNVVEMKVSRKMGNEGFRRMHDEF
jgi:hypothetical protein